MKIQGKKIEGPNIEICVIPRGEGENIVFRCQAVMDMDEFDKLCRIPQPPVMRKPGSRQPIADLEDPKYKIALEAHATKRMDYIVLKSLQATEGLEWETVKMGDSDTWVNYRKELTESGFSNIEVMRIINACMAANCLDEGKVEKARNDFLASAQESVNGQSSQKEEQLSIMSGEQPKELESVHLDAVNPGTQ